MLDGITTGIKDAYSTRKLLTVYASSAIRVQRISDNAQQDIGFSANVLDTAALATFCSGTTGKVVTWYDQAGGGNNLTQGTIANAPIIYQSGAVNALNTKPAILFVAANSTTLNNATLTGNPVDTLFQNAVVSLNDTAGTEAISAGAGGGGGGGNDSMSWRTDQTNGNLQILADFSVLIATSS